MPAARARHAALTAFCAALLAGIVWIGEARAHLWHDAAKDLDPTVLAATVTALEEAAQAAEESHWRPADEIADSSYYVAFELMRAKGRLSELPGSAERLLTTYDALRFGVIDATGTPGPDVDLSIWMDLVRPADAPAVAPFRERLDAWRAMVLGEGKP